MTNNKTNLRKAAVFLRSVDADTAATLLAQLSSEEAAALREAVRALGPLDPEEQADVAAEFRREKPANRGVELSISSTEFTDTPAALATTKSNGKRFEFLEHAPAKTLASYLAREHAQTIAVVLSHLAPERAATVLAALPDRTQAETMERLSNLGDTDSEVVTVLEHELAAWLNKRGGDAAKRGRRRDAVASILAAADAKTRDSIVANLKTRNVALADEIHNFGGEQARPRRNALSDESRIVRSIAKRQQVNAQLRSLLPSDKAGSTTKEKSPPAAPSRQLSAPALPRIDFDHLIHLDTRMLARLLAVADPTVLALALAGSNDELVERVCDQMPKRVAKLFRRTLRRMGPTRLSDVEAAQRVIAEIAAQQIADRRNGARHGDHVRSASPLNV
jgi:flagellar motor switch protein FliG